MTRSLGGAIWCSRLRGTMPRLGYTVNEARFWIYFRSIERSRPSTQTDLTRAERKRGRKKEEIARGTPNRFAIFARSLSLSLPFFALDDENDDDNEEQSIRHFIKRLISRRDFIPSQVA